MTTPAVSPRIRRLAHRWVFALLWLMPFTHFDGCDAGDQRTASLCRRTRAAGNIRRHYPSGWPAELHRPPLIANVINLGADLGAMGDVTQMLIGVPVGHPSSALD